MKLRNKPVSSCGTKINVSQKIGRVSRRSKRMTFFLWKVIEIRGDRISSTDICETLH